VSVKPGVFRFHLCVLISDEYLKPVMTLHPTSVVALKDGMLNLTCQAVTSSRSMLSVLWKKDHTVSTGLLLILQTCQATACIHLHDHFTRPYCQLAVLTHKLVLFYCPTEGRRLS